MTNREMLLVDTSLDNVFMTKDLLIVFKKGRYQKNMINTEVLI